MGCKRKNWVCFLFVCVYAQAIKELEWKREREKKHKKQQTKNKPVSWSSPNFLVVLCRTASRPNNWFDSQAGRQAGRRW
jgi:hypothetical protein